MAILTGFALQFQPDPIITMDTLGLTRQTYEHWHLYAI